jgi:hypothetical protein
MTASILLHPNISRPGVGLDGLHRRTVLHFILMTHPCRSPSTSLSACSRTWMCRDCSSGSRLADRRCVVDDVRMMRLMKFSPRYAVQRSDYNNTASRPVRNRPAIKDLNVLALAQRYTQMPMMQRLHGNLHVYHIPLSTSSSNSCGVNGTATPISQSGGA